MKLSRMTSRTQALPTVLIGFDDLADFITSGDWAPGIFKDNYRNLANFESTQILALDVDDGCPLTEAVELFKDYQHVIATTQSHQQSKHGVVADRFRVLLFLERPITDAREFKATFKAIEKQFPFVDEACSDASRFFYKSVNVVSVSDQGAKVPVVPYEPTNRPTPIGTVEPKTKSSLKMSTYKFLAEGAPAGRWNKSLHLAALDMRDKGYSESQAIEKLSAMSNDNFSGELDDKDLKTIASAFASEQATPGFPVMIHVKSTGQYVPDANSPENMIHLFTNILGLELRYNELSGTPLLNGTPITGPDVPILKNAARTHKLNPFVVEDTIVQLSMEKKFHPFKEVVEAAPWDGHDHILDLFNTLAIDYSEGEPLIPYEQFLRRWIRGMIAKVYNPGQQNLMLVFTGAQGQGKSAWFSKFNVAPGIFTEAAINPDDKDHLAYHLDYVLVLVDELENVTNRRDVGALKAFLTRDKVTVRPAYERYPRRGASIVSFAASVNEKSFLVDDTGNRRYLVIPLNGIDRNHTVPMQQVLAQAYAEYKAGQQWWFDPADIQKIITMNELYEVRGTIETLAARVTHGTEKLNGMEILEQLGQAHPANGDLIKLGRILAAKKIRTSRDHDSTGRGRKLTYYYVKIENATTKHLQIVKDKQLPVDGTTSSIAKSNTEVPNE